MIKNPTYKFYEYSHLRADGTTSTRIVAVSSFAGQPVKGYADCHPNDEFDRDYGYALASARCAEKIAAKRCKRAYSKVDEAKAQLVAAMVHLEKMLKYEVDAEANYNTVSCELASTLSLKQCNCDGDCGENCDCNCHK